MEANCTKCHRRSSFKNIEKNKYKCMSCGSTLHKCMGNDCENMISLGLYCKKCVGDGLKNGVALVGSAIALVGVVVLKKKK